MDDEPEQPSLGYEFSEDQNRHFASLAASMNLVALLFYLLGLGGLMPLVGHHLAESEMAISQLAMLLAQIPLCLCIGHWTRGAAKSIRQIVDSEGNDIDHLMTAVSNLNRFYGLQKWAILSGMIAVLVLLGLIALTKPGVLL